VTIFKKDFCVAPDGTIWYLVHVGNSGFPDHPVEASCHSGQRKRQCGHATETSKRPFVLYPCQFFASCSHFHSVDGMFVVPPF
jgi:hypothetical protein